MTDKKEVPIPGKFWKEAFRFLKIQGGGKAPTKDMGNWQKDNYKFNDTELLNHINNGGNYGIIGGYGNLVIIDSDSEETTKICEEKLPTTFTVNSGSEEEYKKHFFFITYEEMKPIRLSKRGLGDLGDIRSTGQYVVGPNCKHPSGNYYSVEKDEDIKQITKGKILEAFEEVIDKNENTEFNDKEFERDTKIRKSKYIRECRVLDYCRKNKLKKDTAKNWKLFPMIVDIAYNRQLSPKYLKDIIKKQGHNPGAIKGWMKYASEGKLAKSSCKKMRNYLEQYHPNKIDEICGDCPKYKKIKKKKEIKKKNMSKLKEKVLMSLADGNKDVATEEIVRHIEDKNNIYTTREDNNSEMWIYNDGIYVPEGKSYIKEICRKILGKAHRHHITKQVINKVEADTYIDKDEFFRQNNKDEIPVQNGILNIVTRELKEYNPERIFFNKLPVEYNPGADCPNIDKHFKEVLKNEDDIKVMYEIIGFLLYKEYFLEKAIMFVGDGRNGKGKTIDLIRRFIGPKNCSSIPLNSLKENNFRISELFGKMVNLAGDLDNTSLKETGMLKETTARDVISAKRKFKSEIQFVNYAKHIFACNELPKVYDNSKGFWSRWLLFEFPYEFVDEDYDYSLDKEERKNKKIKDPNHIEKISKQEELNGLLNKALDGLQRILENKKFSYSKGTEEVKKLWVRKSDSFSAFCLDHLEEENTGSISKKKLRKCYHNYCKNHEIRGTSDKAIKVTLEKMFGVSDEQRYEDGVTSRYWTGITFKDGSKYQIGPDFGEKGGST